MSDEKKVYTRDTGEVFFIGVPGTIKPGQDVTDKPESVTKDAVTVTEAEIIIDTEEVK